MLLRLLLLLLLLFAFFVPLRSQVQASNFCGFIHLMGDGYLKLAISMETLMIKFWEISFFGVFRRFSATEADPNRPVPVVTWWNWRPGAQWMWIFSMTVQWGSKKQKWLFLTNTGGALWATKKVHHYYFFSCQDGWNDPTGVSHANPWERFEIHGAFARLRVWVSSTDSAGYV